MLCSAAARTEAALGIFDIARHYAFTLFARSRLYAAHPPAPVIGEVRFVILRRTAFPLRVRSLVLLVLLASRRARREPDLRRQAQLAHRCKPFNVSLTPHES